MAIRVQFRRGSTSEHSTFAGAIGEVGAALAGCADGKAAGPVGFINVLCGGSARQNSGCSEDCSEFHVSLPWLLLTGVGTECRTPLLYSACPAN